MAPSFSKLMEARCPSDRPALCFRNGFCCFMHEFCSRLRNSCEPCFPHAWSEDKQREFCLTSQNVSQLNDPTCVGACASKYPALTPQGVGSVDSGLDWWPWHAWLVAALVAVFCGALLVYIRKQQMEIRKQRLRIAKQCSQCHDGSPAPPLNDGDGDVVDIRSQYGLTSLRSFSEGNNDDNDDNDGNDGNASNGAVVPPSDQEPLIDQNAEATTDDANQEINPDDVVFSGAGEQQRLLGAEPQVCLPEIGVRDRTNGGPRVNEQRAPNTVEGQPRSPRADMARNMSFHMSETNNGGPSSFATALSNRVNDICIIHE